MASSRPAVRRRYAGAGSESDDEHEHAAHGRVALRKDVDRSALSGAATPPTRGSDALRVGSARAALHAGVHAASMGALRVQDRQTSSEEVGGAGAFIEELPGAGRYAVTSLAPNGPAARSGRVAVGDFLVGIDGFAISPATNTIDDVRSRIRGAVGTVVRLHLTTGVTRPHDGLQSSVGNKKSTSIVPLIRAAPNMPAPPTEYDDTPFCKAFNAVCAFEKLDAARTSLCARRTDLQSPISAPGRVCQA